MRQIFLMFFILLNAVMIVINTSFDISINFLSYRIIIIAFTLLLSIVFILEKTSKTIRLLAILSTFIAVIHICLVIHNVYVEVYI